MAQRVLLLVVLLLLALGGVLLHVTNPAVLSQICREDSVVEWLTALFCLFASGLFVYTNRKYSFRNVWLWGYALLLLLIAGEEISWGQRIFCIETPGALARINVQEEMNIHNVRGIHGHVRALGLVLVAGVCFVVPLSNSLVSPLRRWYTRLGHPVFPLWAVGIVAVGVLFMAVPRVALSQIIFNLDEIGEFYLAVGFLVFGAAVALGAPQEEETAGCPSSGDATERHPVSSQVIGDKWSPASRPPTRRCDTPPLDTEYAS